MTGEQPPLPVPGGIYDSGDYVGWHTDDEAWKAAKIAELLQRIGLPVESVADVGCGTGGVISELKRLAPGLQVAGFEVSEIPLERARGLHPTVPFTVGFPEPGAFDAIMLIDVIEHVPDCWGLVERALATAPYLIAHIPLEMNVTCVLRPSSLADARRQLGHIHHFSIETAEALLTDCGFEIVARTVTAGTVELPAATAKRRLAKHPRRMLSRLSPTLAARLLGGFEVLLVGRSTHASSERVVPH